jgi:hypothetical protein
MGDERLDFWTSTRNFHICYARVQTIEVESAISLTDERESRPRLTVVRTVIFELRFLPYVWARPDGKCTSSGRMMLGLSNIRTVRHVVWTDGTVDRWASRRDDTSSGRLTGTLKSSVWKVVQNHLKHFWIVESLFKKHLYKQVILSKHRMRPITN